MNRKTAAATLGVTGALCSAALAHCPPYWYEIVAIEGDVVAGVGAITGFGKVAVSGGGDWRVEAHTDHPDPAARTVMLGRKPFLRQGQSLVEPPGATLAGFEDFDIVFSSRAWIFRLETGSAADNAGLYLNDAMLIQKGDVSSAPEFAPGTTYGELLHIRFDRFRSIEMLLMAEVEDPATGPAQAIVRVQYDPATGEVIERALRKSGDILPGQTEPIDTFPAGRSGYAGFFRDQFALVADLEGAPERDSVLYLGDMLLAQEGDESVLPGRRWQALEAVTATEVVAARARVDGDPASDTLIVAWPIGTPGQPEILAQKGGAVPGVPGAVFTDFGAAPLAPGLWDSVRWYGAWAGGEGIFEGGIIRDREPVIVAGETVIDGRLVTGVAGDEHALGAFESFIVARVTLDGSESAVVLVRKSGEGFCYADFDCNGYFDFWDYLAFQDAFAAGDPSADCDGTGTLTFFDFLCFLDSSAC